MDAIKTLINFTLPQASEGSGAERGGIKSQLIFCPSFLQGKLIVCLVGNIKGYDSMEEFLHVNEYQMQWQVCQNTEVLLL